MWYYLGFSIWVTDYETAKIKMNKKVTFKGYLDWKHEIDTLLYMSI